MKKHSIKQKMHAQFFAKFIVAYSLALFLPFVVQGSNNIIEESGPEFIKRRLEADTPVRPEQLKGSIDITNNEKDEVPEFRIYFNGMETFNNKEGFFNFPVDDALDEYALIVTKNIDYHVEKNNTLKELVIKNSDDYRYFSLRKTGTSNAAWTWEEQSLKTNNFVVPYKSILLFVNPKCLATIEPWKVSLPEKFVPIPRIILKGKYINWMERQADKSLLYSLDLKPFHERIRERHKVTPDGLGKMELTSRE